MKPPVITTGDQAFAPRKQYAIPSYQRNYVWTERDHWQPLWEDVRELTNQLVANGEKTTKPHFLGTIITKEIGTEGYINRWWVVDGQQRLTTLQVLIAAAHAAFVKRGLTQAAILSDLLANPPNSVRPEAKGDKYKIQHKSSEYAGFTAIIDSALSSDPGDPSRDFRLDECYAYFLTTVGDWLDSMSPSERGASAGAMTTAILSKLQVVDIRLDDRENSHTIFETLNARGAPLTEWEKTKNYILSMAVREGDPDGDQFYRDHLERYDADPYWNETVTGTRFRGKRIDLFLFFFAQLELPMRRHAISGEPIRTLRRSQLYREFRYVGEHIYRTAETELTAMLSRVSRYAGIYRDITDRRKSRFSPYALEVMRRASVVNLSSLVPVFMELVHKLGSGTRFDQALRVVDSYLMRRVALKAYYSGFDDVAFAHVQALRDAPSDEIISVLIEQFSKSPGRHWWPSDEQVSWKLRNGNMYSGIAKARLRMLLGAIAKRMHTENPISSDGEFTLGEVSVEHVAPQNWQRHWKEALNFDDSEEARHRLNQLVHRIGNLTLVAYNSKLSDWPWAKKYELLRKDRLEMNKRLLKDREHDTWNEGEINRRSRQLAVYVNEIWPHADALRRELGVGRNSQGSAQGDAADGSEEDQK